MERAAVEVAVAVGLEMAVVMGAMMSSSVEKRCVSCTALSCQCGGDLDAQTVTTSPAPIRCNTAHQLSMDELTAASAWW